MGQTWFTFLQVARPSVDWQAVGLILSLDPGETTGWSRFDAGQLLDCGQYTTGRDPTRIANLIREAASTDGHPLSHIVYESYRIRGNKAQEHVGSEVVTIQHIGAIKVVANDLDVPITGQSAGMAKGFATDAKLRRWGLYQTNLRHSNDSIRHGVYWLLFNSGRSGRKEPTEE